jgi:hypothetical protein
MIAADRFSVGGRKVDKVVNDSRNSRGPTNEGLDNPRLDSQAQVEFVPDRQGCPYTSRGNRTNIARRSAAGNRGAEERVM